MADPSSPPECLHRDATLVVAEAGPLLVPVWWDAPTVEQMRLLVRLSADHNRRSAGGTFYAQFVVDGTPRFSNDVRKLAEELTREYFDLGIAHVIEIGGLRGAATRAFLGSLMLVSRGTKAMKVFDRPEPAAEWIAGQLRAGGDARWTAARVLAVRGFALEQNGERD